MEFDWWKTIQARERLSNIHCSAVIGYVLIGLRTFSWQVQIQVVWRERGEEKTRFNLKIIQIIRTYHITINLDLNRRGSREGHKPL